MVYIEQLEQFLLANNTDEEKHVAMLLSLMGATTYGLLRNCSKPQEKTFGLHYGKPHERPTVPVVVFLDHLLIMGHSEKEHRDILQEVLQHLLENDLQVQHSKCEFSKTQVDYLSHILDKQVIHPSKDEVRAIQEAPSPTNVKELQAFLGLVNYYGRFVPQQSTVLAPLHKRLREHATWKWAEVEPAAFLKCTEQLHGLKQKKKSFD